MLTQLVEKDDYLFWLLKERIRFIYQEDTMTITAHRGIPFGTAVACLFANIYLSPVDFAMEKDKNIDYFRYADDLIAISRDRESVVIARQLLEKAFKKLKLTTNPDHQKDLLFSQEPVSDEIFQGVNKFRHLGLEFKANGLVALSRDKFRKICNLFRYAFRRNSSKLKRIKDPEERVKKLVTIAQETLNRGVRNVSLIDYYLKHVQDERQLWLLDRWLAEEVLARVLNSGHKKGNFRKISYKKLRNLGLPSLQHRRRLIMHRHIQSSFFIWREHKARRIHRGAAARSSNGSQLPGSGIFSPDPNAMLQDNAREREKASVDGCY